MAQADYVAQLPDSDPQETAEWLDSFDAVATTQGPGRAADLVERLVLHARASGVDLPVPLTTPYVNTIPASDEPPYPGDIETERQIRAYLRWNAAAMVVRANRDAEGIGGHLSTYASAASLIEVGFNHFFRGPGDGGGGDHVYFQGHASPGIYARAYLEGRLGEDELTHFRREVGGHGLSSYPHPRLMPEFWQFPTVSMGLGPLMAVHQAHVDRYLAHRGVVDTSAARIWCFCGDGELDEPEAVGALGIAGRERLDNLVFVVNCNLQRLDGPVRGNGKIIQELEATFHGAGWNVIKVIWGTRWDPLLAADVDGVLVDRMGTALDGDYQKYATETGAYIRNHFFGTDPRLKALVADFSDAEIAALPRGGHDIRKVYAAYAAAVAHRGEPTVVLAKTVKGWHLGPEIEARNATHAIKKMGGRQLLELRDRLSMQGIIPDEAIAEGIPPFVRPEAGSAVHEYLMAHRAALGGALPSRRSRPPVIGPPAGSMFTELLAGSGAQAVSTTSALARILRNLVRDPALGPRIVPIVPDEGRSFGLEPLFSEVKIYAPGGQHYTPVDAGLLLSYAESDTGQILEEGISEAGATASFIAAATAHATWSTTLVPFYLFYSMFGFQRVGDVIWAAADVRSRGFLVGTTAGRTTYNGEGLQHEDGHSHLLAMSVPSIVAYDFAFAYELAIVVEAGIAEMCGPEPRDVLYYLTTYNETYRMPAMPEDPVEVARVREGVLAGLYRFAPPPGGGTAGVHLWFSGPAWQAAMQARETLAAEWGVEADAWSLTSPKLLREDALSVERWNRLHPTEEPRISRLGHVGAELTGPVVAVSDYMAAVPHLIDRWVGGPGPFVALGTEGFGRSDTRDALRRFFEVDAAHLVVAALGALDRREDATAAIARYGIDPEAPPPWTG